MAVRRYYIGRGHVLDIGEGIRMLTKLRRETLAEQAIQGIMQLIQQRGLRPGAVLPSESKLAAEFGVSRPVIREAYKALAGMGVIEIVNGKGAVVQAFDSNRLRVLFVGAIEVNPETILELMEVRKGIEVESAILAARRRTPDELHRLQQIVSAMREHLDDIETYIVLDVELHLQIASATHNWMMYSLVESIRSSLAQMVRAGYQQRKRDQHERVQILHELVVDAIARGDAEAAGHSMAMHFDDAAVALAGTIPADKGAEDGSGHGDERAPVR
jgi:GntR family transcriptional regulator, transcriptional repressor for pyruvate dehydrogenase complex